MHPMVYLFSNIIRIHQPSAVPTRCALALRHWNQRDATRLARAASMLHAWRIWAQATRGDTMRYCWTMANQSKFTTTKPKLRCQEAAQGWKRDTS